MLAQEAYSAAADPNRFPEQIKEGLRPWTPLKVYARSPFARATGKTVYDYATGKTEPLLYKNYVTGKEMPFVPPATVTVPSGTYNALFGESYLQVAREGLNQQKSQNGGIQLPPPGPADSSYHLYASRVGEPPSGQESGFFEGIDTSLEGIAAYLPAARQPALRAKLAEIDAQVKEATGKFDALDPSRSAPALSRGLDLTRALIASLRADDLPADSRYNAIFELEIKGRQFNLALGQSLGMAMLATAQAAGASAVDTPMGRMMRGESSQTAVPGETLGVSVRVADQGLAPVRVDAVTLVPAEGDWKVHPAREEGQTSAAGTMAAGSATDVYLTATVPDDAKPTGPYYSRPNLEQSWYDIQDPRWLTQPTAPYPLSARLDYTFAGTHASLSGVVQTAHRYNGLGVLNEPLLIVPAISVLVSPSSGVLPLDATSLALQVTVHSSVKGPAQGTLKLELPQGWTAEPAQAVFSTMRDNEDVVLTFQVKTPGLAAKTYQLNAVAEYSGRKYTSGFTTIGYPGIRPALRFWPATSRIQGVDVHVPAALKVGYVMGSGDEVPQCLREIGVNPVMLTDLDLQRGDLSGYDAIVLGVRTYTARPALRAANSRLLEYVRNGGTVVVQYQDAAFNHDYGPYPLSVPGDQGHTVVEEDAKVTLLRPSDPAMTWPNTIRPADFDGWVEERGHGFPESFSGLYTALTEVHDTGQDPQKGGLVYARSGKGFYVYLAYAFFREMPEGVPGSFRIMANLLSLGRNPGLQDGHTYRSTSRVLLNGTDSPQAAPNSVTPPRAKP